MLTPSYESIIWKYILSDSNDRDPYSVWNRGPKQQRELLKSWHYAEYLIYDQSILTWFPVICVEFDNILLRPQ